MQTNVGDADLVVDHGWVSSRNELAVACTYVRNEHISWGPNDGRSNLIVSGETDLYE